jgi:hypothetical protein
VRVRRVSHLARRTSLLLTPAVLRSAPESCLPPHRLLLPLPTLLLSLLQQLRLQHLAAGGVRERGAR